MRRPTMRWSNVRWLRTTLAIVASMVLVGCTPILGGVGGGGHGGTHTPLVPMALVLGDSGSVANRFDIDVEGLFPGEIPQRTLDVAVKGRAVSFSTLRIDVTQSSLLDTDMAGLKIRFDICDSGWVEHDGYVYTCTGALRTVIQMQPLALAKQSTWTVRFGPGNVAHTRMSVMLPPDAANRMGGLTTKLGFAFNAEILTGH